MNQDLMERYIYAVTKELPKKQRGDVAQELRGLIDDMLTERCEGRTPEEKDVRIILTELGSPRELYSKYAEDGEKCLIGQPHYSTYIFVLKIVLASGAAGITLVSLLLQMLEPQGWLQAAGDWLSMLWNVLVSAFTFVTLLFAFFYHREIPIDNPLNFDDLPMVPKRRQEISKGDCVAGMVLCVIFAALFLGTPQLICAYMGDTGEWIPIFQTEEIRRSWHLILVFSACGIAGEAVKLIQGQYNKTVLVTVGATNLISALASVWLLAGRDLMNPYFTAEIAQIFQGDAGFLTGIFSNFQYFCLCVILFALVLDTVIAAERTFRT